MIIQFDELIRMSNSEDVNEREQAARLLANFSASEKAEKLLLNLLKDENWRVRKASSEVILMLRTPSLIKGVVKALYNDENVGERNAAMDILLNLGQLSLPYLRAEYDTKHSDVKLFIATLSGDLRDIESLPFLYRCLEDANDNVISAAIVSIGRIGKEESIPYLIKYLDYKNSWLQYQAIEALGLIGHSDCVKNLAKCYENVYLRSAVIKALANIDNENSLIELANFLNYNPNSELVSALCKLIFSPRPEVLWENIKEKYLHILKKNIEKRTIDMLISNLSFEIKEENYNILNLLSFLQIEEAIEYIKPWITSLDTMMKGFELLKRYNPDSLLQLKNFIENLDEDIILLEYISLFWSATSEESIRYIEKFLQSSNDQIRLEAYKIIANVLKEKSFNYLIDALDDENNNIREYLASQIIELAKKDKEVLKIVEGKIEELINSKSENLRAYSIYLGYSLFPKKYLKRIIEGTKSESSLIRYKALQCLGEEDISFSYNYIKMAMTDEDPKIRELAVKLLGKSDNSEAVSLLISALTDEDIWVRCQAIRSLSFKPNNKVFEILQKEFSNFATPLKLESLKYFGKMNTKESRALLIKNLSEEDEEIRIIAAQSLSPEDRDSLSALVDTAKNDKNWKVREEAIKSLAKKPTKTFKNLLYELCNKEADAFVRKTLIEIMEEFTDAEFQPCIFDWFADARLMDSVINFIKNKREEVMLLLDKQPYKISDLIKRSLNCIK